MEIEYLNSILYLQYNTIAEEAHSHPVCEGSFCKYLNISNVFLVFCTVFCPFRINNMSMSN